MAELQLRGVNKSFGAVQVLHNVDLDVADGEFVVFVGPSGCGKSTLLRMIAGLESITAGELEIGGVRMNDVDPSKRGIAMVFQSYALYPTMTVRGNLSFGLKVKRLSKAEINRRVSWAAGLLQLSALLDRKPGQLSGGQRQRVAIGRALVQDAKLFLFDEPLSNLDAKLRVDMRTEIKQLHQRIAQSIASAAHPLILLFVQSLQVSGQWMHLCSVSGCAHAGQLTNGSLKLQT
jgi:ABC-type sugar transport system ATPase subunit